MKKRIKQLTVVILAFLMCINYNTVGFFNMRVLFAKEGIVQMISSFAQEEPQYYYFNGKPDLEEIMNSLPDTIEVYLENSEEITEIPVSWKCEGDYEDSHYYYYQFNPVWDENEYGCNLVELPYAGIYVTNATNKNGLKKSVTSSPHETTVYNFLINNVGLNTAGACGVMANIQCESNFSPTAVNPNDTGGTKSYGICQWNNGEAAGNRYNKLITWCNNNGYDYTTLTGQLYFMKHELDSDSYFRLSTLKAVANTADGASEAALCWAKYYEGCSSSYYTTRQDLARNKYWPEYAAVTELKITNYNTPGTLTQGSTFSIKGTISSPTKLTSVTVGVYDYDEKCWTGKTVNPNSTTYDIHNMDNDILFNNLPAGMYAYRVIATNSAGTTWLVAKAFAVLGTSATVQDGTYYIRSNSNSDRSVGIAGDSNESNANVEVQESRTSAYQAFYFKYKGNGIYSIRDVGSGMYLDVEGGATASGTNVWQHAYNGSKAQSWYVLPCGSIYCLVPQHATETALDMRSGNQNIGDTVQIYNQNLTNAQKFRLVRTDGDFEIGHKITFDAQGGSFKEAHARRKVDGFNTGRGTQQLIVYNVPGMTVDTNQYGGEVVVSADGTVTQIRAYGSTTQVKVPDGGMVVSGHFDNGKGGVEFTDQVSVGNYVGCDYEDQMVYAYGSYDAYLASHKYVEDAEAYGDLPIPEREGYLFDGWYTREDGGTRINRSSTYAADTLYARWREEGDPAATAEVARGHHKYEIYDYSMSWKEARAFCEARGGYLATITSQEENDLLKGLTAEGNQGYYSIGCSSEEEVGKWEWVTGEAFGYSNWDTDYPEGNAENEGYAYFIAKDNPPNKAPGEWIDRTDRSGASSGFYHHNNGGLICEYDVKYGQTIAGSDSYTKTYGDDPFTLDVRLTEGDGSLSYHSSDTGVVEVTDDGRVAIKGAGTAVITVTVSETEEYEAASKEITVKVEKASPAISAVLSADTIQTGERAKVSASTSGDGAIRYQIDDENIATVDGSGMITGKQAGTVTVTVTSEETRNYRGASMTLTLTVEGGKEAATITSHPEDYTGAVGETAVFTVRAEGTGLSYQWQYSNDRGNAWKYSSQSGNKTDTIKVPVTAARDGQQYRCVVTDGEGNKAISSAARLIVGAATQGVSITSHPENYTGAVGETAVFTVRAEGTGLSYQWQYSNDGGNAWKNSSQNGSRTYMIKVPITAARNGQQYRCVVTDERGNSVTSEAGTLRVQ